MERIKLDLVPGCVKPILWASQYDNGREWTCDIYNNGVPYVFQEGDTVDYTIRKGDGLLVTGAVAVTPDTSNITLVSTEQMCAVYGSNLGELIVKSNGVKVGSGNFILEVERAPDENGITSQSEIKNLARQVHNIVVEELEDNGAKETGYDNTESGLEATNVQDAIDEVNTKINNIPSVDAYTKQESDSFLADEYDATQTYAVGDYRIHEGGLYVCNTPIATPEAWNASHWTLTDVGSALGQLAEAVNGKADSDDVYGKQAVDDKLASKADASEVNYMLEENADVKTSTEFTFYPETSGNVYNGNNVRIETNVNYDSYFLVLDKATSIYFDGTLPTYTSICYGVPPCTKEPDRLRWACSSATRYRNLDNNLPSKVSPLSVAKNGVILVTVTKGETVSLYGLGLAYKFTDNAKAQIVDTINIKKPLVISDTNASGNVTERAYIYIPSKVGYIEYDFAHFVKQSINADTWNIRMTNAVDEELANRYLITTTGEFECAIKIDGAPDFMGGISHGSEVITGSQFLLDGKPITLADISTIKEFEELRIIVTSNLYDPTDEVTIVAEHSKEYIFNESGLTINQMVRWLNAHTLTDSYMAMFPTAKSIINKMRVNNKIDTFTLSQTTPSIASGVNHAYAWGDNLSCDFDILEWNIEAQSPTGIGAFFTSDNGGQNYYKQYYKALASGNVQYGNTWLTSARYKIQIGA